jgi:hypothetical protein
MAYRLPASQLPEMSSLEAATTQGLTMCALPMCQIQVHHCDGRPFASSPSMSSSNNPLPQERNISLLSKPSMVLDVTQQL